MIVMPKPLKTPVTTAPDTPPVSVSQTSFLKSVYRFLASLKLAVIGLSSLAALLAYATFFESWYGTEAARAYVYRSPVFYIVNMMLFANILCAATIRYPWKRHQIGFVVTHLGLLTLISGSFISQKLTDDGQVGLAEGVRMSCCKATARTVRVMIRMMMYDDACMYVYMYVCMYVCMYVYVGNHIGG